MSHILVWLALHALEKLEDILPDDPRFAAGLSALGTAVIWIRTYIRPERTESRQVFLLVGIACLMIAGYIVLRHLVWKRQERQMEDYLIHLRLK